MAEPRRTHQQLLCFCRWPCPSPAGSNSPSPLSRFFWKRPIFPWTSHGPWQGCPWRFRYFRRSFPPHEKPIEFPERLHLPSFWDLVEINIPEREASRAAGRTAKVRVCFAPREPVKVIWHDSTGTPWRIPHTWRRRRVRLPDREVLIEQGVPNDIAEEFSNRAVSVNYHPGSLCCLPDQYRFRDSAGNRYPVHISGCTLLGYGDAEEHRVSDFIHALEAKRG